MKNKTMGQIHYLLQSKQIICALLLLISCASCLGTNSSNSVSNRIEKLADECFDQYSDIIWISMEEYLNRSTSEEWAIIDVRTEEERSVSIIPGAMTIGEFERRAFEFTNKPILVYCTVGCRSGAYVRKLEKLGIKSFNLRGGVLSWANSGKMFVTTAGGTTNRVHVNSKKWNVLPSGYDGVM